MGSEFSPEQKRYLEGLVSGIQAGRGRTRTDAARRGWCDRSGEPTGPDAIHFKAQDRTSRPAGKKLVDQENWKRDEHPFDAYPRLKEQAAKGEYPKPPDNFRWRYHGLFYVAPGTEQLHVPPQHSERHPERTGSSRGSPTIAESLRRRLRPRHDARQHPDPRDRRPRMR